MRGDRPDILWLDKDPRTLCTVWDRIHGASQWPDNPAGWLGKAEHMRGTSDSSWFYSHTGAARAILAAALAAVTTGKAIERTAGDPAAGTLPGISATFLIG